MAIRGEKNGYIAKFLPGEKLLYSHFSGGKFYYIAIFPGGKMARGKNYYTTPGLLVAVSRFEWRHCGVAPWREVTANVS